MKLLVNITDGVLNVRAIRRYVYELVCGLGSRSDIDLHLLYFSHRLKSLREFLDLIPAQARYRVHSIPAPRSILRKRYQKSRWELRQLEKRVDLYHDLYFDLPCFETIPYVATLHGLFAHVRPDLCTPEHLVEMVDWSSRATQLASHFVAVSESTRFEFLERFPVEPERVTAVPLGVSPQYFVDKPSDPNREARYLLYVGGIQPNKNIPFLFEVFGRLVRETSYPGDLYLVGNCYYSEDEYDALIEAAEIRGRVHRVGFFDPEDPEIARLYRGAELFLFPSLYEGWTSPPLEAMASRVPVIASDISSIPETVGDGALLADPTDASAWVEAAQRLIRDSALRRAMIDRGFARASSFPWSRCVEKTVSVYEGLLTGTARTESSTQPELEPTP